MNQINPSASQMAICTTNTTMHFPTTNNIISNKEFCVTRTVEHNYILPISTVRIQLHVSVLYVDHLQVEIFNLQISYTRCGGHLGGPGGERGKISLFQ